MTLNFENVDFDHVEQTINGTILYCICSCNVINKEVNDINENSLKLFLQSLAKDKLEDSKEILANICAKSRELEDNKELTYFAYSLKKLCNLTYMQGIQGFTSAVESFYFVFDKQSEKIKTVYLYKDKSAIDKEENDIEYCRDLTLMRGVKSILEKTKEITHKCINENLSKYYSIEGATRSFVQMFASIKTNVRDN